MYILAMQLIRFTGHDATLEGGNVFSASRVRQNFRCGSKFNRRGYAGFGPRFHLPGFHFGTGFLSHSQMVSHLCLEFKSSSSAGTFSLAAFEFSICLRVFVIFPLLVSKGKYFFPGVLTKWKDWVVAADSNREVKARMLRGFWRSACGLSQTHALGCHIHGA